LWFCLPDTRYRELPFVGSYMKEGASIESRERLLEYLQEHDRALGRIREVLWVFLALFFWTFGRLPDYIHKMITAHAEKTKLRAALTS
jgi:hypothetical protein